MKQGKRSTQVIDAIRRKITGRALMPGEKLPSVRGLAAQMKVSPSTVVDVYDRLVAEGVIYARRGSGFYLADIAQPFAVAEVGPQLDRAIDPFWVSRQSLDAGEGALKSGCGWLPASWMPTDSVRRALRGLARSGDSLLSEYGTTLGAPNFRRLLARQFGEEGLSVSPDQILLTNSGTQAIDMICRFLLRPGDTVLVDDPCYFNFQALLKAHQLRLVSVPYTPNGPDIRLFEQVLSAERPRLYITNSALHNPTGATMSLPVAHRILSLSAQHDLVVVEDDIFAGLEPELSPRLAALDGLDRVIRIGSFSKTLSASLRCGYIAARPDWIESLIDLQVATNFSGPGPLATELVCSVLQGGQFRKHIEALHSRLSRCRRDVSENLSSLGIRPWVMPRGGFYLWSKLPEGVDSAEVARLALARDVVLAPGNVFSVAQSCAGFMRFNVSQMDDTRIYEVLEGSLHEISARTT